MSDLPQVKDLLLDNGLHLYLIADPHAHEAAALMQTAAGSDHEPEAWPGLAHLLEHTLFTGSAHYTGDQRLVSWVIAHGGRLNATTRSDRTACFIALPTPHLAGGLARLLDMVAQPELSLAAIAQETAVIDAEYQLLCHDDDTLLETALRQQFSGAPGLTRFHVGSQQTWGDDMAALQQALRAFHSKHWHAGSMTLWVQAALPLETLEALVVPLTRGLPALRPLATPDIVRLTGGGRQSLQLVGPARLCLTFALNDWQRSDLAWLNLLNMQLRDEAPGGLMAQLRARDWVDEVRFSELWRSSHAAMFSIQFVLSRSNEDIRSGVLVLFDQWLAQLSQITPAQLEHAIHLSRREFWHLPPLDQLRGRSFGLAALTPPDPAGWQRGIARLQQAERALLWVQAEVAGDEQRHQGFTLRLADWPETPGWQGEACRFTFWPQELTPVLPPLPALQRSLLHWRPGGEARLLLLSEPGEREAAILQAALRPLAAALAHQDGDWRNGRYQGHWLMQLRGEAASLESAVVALCSHLASLTPAIQAQGLRVMQRAKQQEESAIPVRRLMGALTRALTLADSGEEGICHLRWQAALIGGDDTQHQRLAHRLSALPGEWSTAPDVPPVRPWQGLTLPRGEGDAALLLYCPLPAWDRDTRLMWRLLALFCQPRFFQQLRVEKNLGYVVSCRFHQWGNEEGILFALQSPHTSAEELWQHMLAFLHHLPAAVKALSENDMAALTQALWHALQQQGQDRVWQVCEQRFTPGMSLIAADNGPWLQRLTPADLLHWLPTLMQAAASGWQGRVA